MKFHDKPQFKENKLTEIASIFNLGWESYFSIRNTTGALLVEHHHCIFKLFCL